MQYKKLYNGVEIPVLGYGTYKTPSGDVCVEGVKTALKTGYRHIDTAYFYGNEASVKDGINDSDVVKNDIFITSKLWNDDHGYDNTLRAFERTYNNLDGHVDLYLIHWPIPMALRDNWEASLKETWRAMERLYDEKVVRAIGVSNHQIRHLEFLLNNCNIKPMVDQIEIHIGYPETEVVDFCKKNDILVEAWAPIAKGRAFDLPEVQEVSKRTGKTPSQVLIRWCLDKGVVPLPKSVTPERIVENFDVFGFSLSKEEMAILDKIDSIGRLGSHPDTCAF